MLGSRPVQGLSAQLGDTGHHARRRVRTHKHTHTHARARTHLRPAIDDVNLVQRHHVHHLLALLQLPFWALHKACGRACGHEVG